MVEWMSQSVSPSEHPVQFGKC